MHPQTTVLLRKASSGDAASGERVAALLYNELHDIAERQFRRENRGHTLQPTAVVHEALMRLLGPDLSGAESGSPSIEFADRTQFLAAAANAMRRVLIDHARKRDARKRGGHAKRISLSDAGIIKDAPVIDLLALEEALGRLRTLNERQSRVVEMRFFAGMTEPEIAALLGVSERTVRGDWLHARAWLRCALDNTGAEA